MVGFEFRAYLPLRLGRVVATNGAKAALDATDSNPLVYLVRHAAGDWGTVCAEDAELNNSALIEGERILSAYTLKDGETTMWIITERDRSVTTLLLPSEY
jgi:hypothetical protein